MVVFNRGRLLVNTLRVVWVVITAWYELGIFFYSVRNCQWPRPDSIVHSIHGPAHVLIIADPQILDHRSYPGRPAYLTLLSRLIVDLNLRKSWRAALRTHPDAVVFLGDMMDGGRFSMSDAEYESYYRRFKSIFKLDSSISEYFLPGNHDTGLGVSASFSAHARDRYISHFGPLNSAVSIANHTVVLLDAPGLVEEDRLRTERGIARDQWRPAHGGSFEFIESFATGRQKDPVILFSHIPLSRPDGASCGLLRERETIRRGVGFGYQNTLGNHATNYLLNHIKPSVVFSGDDHDYCEYNHVVDSPIGEHTQVREVTVKSLSMAMGIRRPGFQLLSLAPPDALPSKTSHADVPCLLPDQLGIYLSIYLPLLVLSLFVILVSNVYFYSTSRRQPGSRSPLTRLNSYNLDGVTTSRSSKRDARSRLEIEIKNNGDEELTYSYPSDDELLSTSHLLPPPASATISPSQSSQSRSAFSWSFVGFGHRRRITISTRPYLLFLKMPFCLFSRRTRRGWMSGIMIDVRDVACFPLGVIALTSLWMFSDG